MKRIILKTFFIQAFCLIFLSGSGVVIPSFEKNDSRISVVVIDPGHGGKDWGASSGRSKEKDIVLDIALKLGNIIKTNFPDVKIIYTRTRDDFVPLHRRADIANKNNANLFISLHVNSVEQKYVQGTETFVLGQHRSSENLEVAKKENSVILLEDNYEITYGEFDPNAPESYIMFELVQDEYLEQSVMLASEIQDQFREKAKRIDRSVKQAGFLVLRRTTMPSVLVEVGFISNSSDRSYLLSESGKTNLASSIFRAFKEYKTKIEEKSKFILVSEDLGLTRSDNPVSGLREEGNSSEKDVYFSVQIMALKRKVETIPENFKGEKNIFMMESKDVNRYYSGRFKNIEEANAERDRLLSKFQSAYVVAIENNKLISVKKAMGKM